MSKIDLRLGDCYELIKTIPDKSVDLVYCDIPYDIEGKAVAGVSAKRNAITTPSTKKSAKTQTARQAECINPQ